MSKKKVGSLMVLALAASALSACSCSKADSGMTYTALYSYDAETLNYMDTNKAENADVFASLVDGLVETDNYGSIQPALATSWEQDATDGRIWTFHIREGVKWLTSDGREYADVKAQDWVTSLKYAIQSDEMNYLITMFIANSEEYLLATSYAALDNDADRLDSDFFYYFAEGYDFFAANGKTLNAPVVGANGNWFYGTTDTGVASGAATADAGKTAYEVAGQDAYTWYQTIKAATEGAITIVDGKFVFEGGAASDSYVVLSDREVAIVWESATAENAFNATLAEYLDFDNVGVKAIDDYTLQYTTVSVQNYFVSALLHSAYYPANEQFITEVGFDSFGTAIDKMLYCGPHMLKVWDIESQVVLTKNKKYWDADNVHIDTVKLIKYDTSNSSNYGWVRTQYEQGLIDGFTVSSSDTEGWAKYVTGADGTGTIYNPAHGSAYSNESEMGSGSSFLLFLNRNFAYSYVENYPHLFKTTFSKEKVQIGNKALDSVNLRKALLYGIDRTYNQENYWADDYINKDQYLSNTYVPKEFAVDENGKDYVDYYAEIYAEKKNVSLETAKTVTAPGYDGLTDLALADTYMAAAKQDLIGMGLTLPVELEFVGLPDADSVAYDEAAIAKWNEELKLPDGTQVVKIVRNSAITTQNDYVYASNFNTGHLTTMGWGPDYADPLTYLDTLTRVGAFGRFAGINKLKDGDDALIEEYERLVEVANSKSLASERLAGFAEAEYYAWHEAAIAIPWGITGRGPRVSVSNIVPYQAMKSSVGCVANKYKFMKVRKSAISRAEREELKAAYEAGKGQN